jgi:hypothetical protein
MGLGDDLEKAKKEVLRKIGRNMLLFQQVEHMLKFLIANGPFSGGIGDIKANKEQRAESGIPRRLPLANLLAIANIASHALSFQQNRP